MSFIHPKNFSEILTKHIIFNNLGTGPNLLLGTAEELTSTAAKIIESDAVTRCLDANGNLKKYPSLGDGLHLVACITDSLTNTISVYAVYHLSMVSELSEKSNNRVDWKVISIPTSFLKKIKSKIYFPEAYGTLSIEELAPANELWENELANLQKEKLDEKKDQVKPLNNGTRSSWLSRLWE